MATSTLPSLGKVQLPDSQSSKNDSEKESHHDRDEHSNRLHRTLTTVTLSPEQFEQLYLQPREARRSYALAGTVGNPTPLGVTVFLAVLLPLSLDLLNVGGATAQSSIAMLGVYYGLAGIGLYLSCIMEWIIGNTFPSVVFGTFGGFFISYGIINQPSMGIAASFAPAADTTNGITAAVAGASTPAYNIGLAMFFMGFGIITFIFFICSLRTNVMFVVLFLVITIAIELLAVGYFHFAAGKAALAATEFKAAGGLAFVVAIVGFYLDISLLLHSVGYPFSLPLIDLSTRFLPPKDVEKQE